MVRSVAGNLPEQVKNNQSVNTAAGNGGQKMSQYSWFTVYHAWKLIDSIDGAKSSAIVYSITETAKANNLNPFRYLEYVLTVMKDHQKDTDYHFKEELLPWFK